MQSLQLFLVVLIFVALVYIVNIKSKQEQFVSTPLLTIIADEKPTHLNVIKPSYIEGKAIQLLRDIKDVTISQAPDSDVSKVVNVHVNDAFTINQSVKAVKDKVLAMLPIQRVLFLVVPIEKIGLQTLLKPAIVIGYTRDEEYTLLNTLPKVTKDALPIPVPNYTLKKIKDVSTIDRKVFDDNEIDGIVMFTSMESTDIQKVSADLKMDVLDYGEYVDIEKLKVAIPYAKKQNIDFSLYFKQLQGKRDSVKTVIAFDTLLHGSDTYNSDPPIEFRQILMDLNNPEMLNYYEQHFDLYDVSKTFMVQRNSSIKERGQRQVLEQYDNAPSSSHQTTFATFEVDKNIDGFYDSVNETFVVNSNMIDNIPMKKGTIILLTAQIRDEENGRYDVTNVKRTQTILQKVTTRKTKAITDNQFDPRYRCYDNPDIVSKGLCESPFDEQGRRKSKQTYWDRPCEINEECPFYQANKTYKNYRGGCIDGRCEMPIGIKQVAYRLYDPSSNPMCHDCKDVSNPYCCDEQTNPNYAFQLDMFERRL